MKKLLLASFALLAYMPSQAKKVKFSVDMTGQTISANGVHVAGDFQTAAGYSGGNWQSGTTSLSQQGSTPIYSVIVNIPSFQKYEYKFVNGNQFYEVEFVPVESRVGYNNNDNRWLYVDSLSTDTLNIGALQFGENAPSGKLLVRFKVDIRNEASVNAAGIHAAGSFQGSDPAAMRLYSFGDSVYEYISYVTTGNYNYKFYNGNTTANSETVPSGCATSGNRTVNVTADIVLPTVCFSSCTACNVTGITIEKTNTASIFPNPATDKIVISFGDNENIHSLLLTNLSGKTIKRYETYNGTQLIINRDNLPAGIYFLKIATGTKTDYLKLILQ